MQQSKRVFSQVSFLNEREARVAPRAERCDRILSAVRRIEALAALLVAPANGDAGAFMECALVAEAAEIIAEEARRIREHLGFLPR